jgi:CRP/FNR family cyclic AMP-dependent transcriptional regulator
VNDYAPNADWLYTLSPAQAKALRRMSTARSYKTGELVFGPSRRPRQVYVLEDGLVRLFRVTATGAELTIGYVKPGEIFGEISVVSDRPREGFGQTRAASRILHVPRAAFVSLLRNHNPILYSVAKRLARRVMDLQSRVQDLVSLDARARLARFLLRIGVEHGHRDDEGLTVNLPLTHEEIGTLIGTSRQTVSLLFRELTDAGLVTRRGGKLVLPHPSRLEAID